MYKQQVSMARATGSLSLTRGSLTQGSLTENTLITQQKKTDTDFAKILWVLRKYHSFCLSCCASGSTYAM